MSEFSRGQIMLTLARLASRGFWDPKKKNQDKLAASIKQGLDELATMTSLQAQNFL